jgi:imidazolonepropionase-like amidohydrolase
MRIRLLGIGCCLAIASTAAFADTTAGARHSAVMMLGKQAGEEIVTEESGQIRVRFSYNDRGRGADTELRMTLDAAGMPSDLRITGKDYYKSPVDEQLASESGVARWKNGAEASSAPVGGFYWPIEAPPMFVGVLAKALLADADRSFGLLPSGTASLVEAQRLTLRVEGKKRQFVLYEINGLGFTPSSVWFDEHGEYLGQVGGWMTVLPVGMESLQAELEQVQTERESARAKEWAQSLADRPAGRWLLSGGRVFDPRTGLARKADVLIEGERIVAMGDEKSMDLADATSIERIDVTDRFVMPGLWDNHVHIGGGADGLLHLAAGVTSARDMANDEEKLPARRQRIDAGEELGPRLTLAGFMDGRSPFSGPTKVFVDEASEAEKWVNWYADNGYEQIKVYSSLKPALVPLIAQLAHRRGLRLSGHVPAFMTAEQFIAAGADELQHLNFVFLNFLYKQAPDTRDMTRFTAVGKYAADIDPIGKRERQLIATMAERRIVLDATVNIFEGMFEAQRGEVDPGYKAISARLPPQVRRGLLLGGLTPAKGDEERYARAFASMLRFLGALHQAGVTILPGTDALAGFALHRELELYAAASIPTADILRLATLGSAEVNRRSHELGVIAPGWLADLIVIDGDPLSDISDVRRVRLVVMGGVRFDPDALYRQLGVAPLPSKAADAAPAGPQPAGP